MSKQPKIPNIAWRDGRPRFMPGAPVRALGYKGEDLRHPDGAWFTEGQALDWARIRSAEIAGARAALVAAANKKRPKGTKPIRHAPIVYTLAKLFEEWQQSPQWSGGEAIGKRRIDPLSDNSKKNYRWKMMAIEKFDPVLYMSAVESLDREIIYGLFETLWEEKGLATARSCIATLSAAISWGMKRGRLRKLDHNPAFGLSMRTPDIVVRFGEREEIAALTRAADAMGRPEIGDMVQLGVWTGQRQNDRLAMVQHSRELVRGRRILRQSKTGVIVAVFQSPELERRISASRKRREQAGIVSPHVILDEKQWTPFLTDHYRHTFAEVRALAVAGMMQGETVADALARQAAADAAGRPAVVADIRQARTRWALPPCPSVATFLDKNLRSTAVVWMALGGSTIPEIISVTGHTPTSANTILRHYLAKHPEMADAAIGKMIAWFDSGEGTATPSIDGGSDTL